MDQGPKVNHSYRLNLSDEQLEERGLANSVRSDNCHTTRHVHTELEVLEQNVLAVAERDVCKEKNT